MFRKESKSKADLKASSEEKTRSTQKRKGKPHNQGSDASPVICVFQSH